MGAFKRILPLMASGINRVSLPSQTEDQVADREEILKIQIQIFKHYLRLDRILRFSNKTYAWGLLSSISTTQYT